MLNNVIDISHHKTVTSLQKVKNNGIVGVCRKATQGKNTVDAKYHARRQRALNAGLLRGASHFGTKGNVDAPVENFLDTVNPSKTDLLVLDFEPNGESGTMTLTEAEKFVTLVKQKTGRFPGLYSGQYFIREKVGSHTATVLKNCFLRLRPLCERKTRRPARVDNLHPPAIHRRQRRRPTAPSPRHRTLRPRQIQRRPRRSETALGRLSWINSARI